MELQDFITEIILTVILVISTLVLVLRFWQDAIVAVTAVIVVLSLWCLFLVIDLKIRELNNNILMRERNLRINMDEVAKQISDKNDRTLQQMNELISEISRRMYR